MMAKLCISDITSRWIIVSPFRQRFLNRDASFFDLCLYRVDRRSLASGVSEPRQCLVACENCAACLALSLPQHLGVSSSSALSQARPIFLRYLSLHGHVNNSAPINFPYIYSYFLIEIFIMNILLCFFKQKI